MKEIPTIIRIFTPYLFTCLFILIVSCEKYLPDAYQEEDFTISILDAEGCEFLTRDLFVTDTVIVNGDTSLVTDTVFSSISTVLLTDLVDSNLINASDSVIISEMFDSLSAAMDSLLSDTTLRISYPTDGDTSYAFYYHNNPGGEGFEVVFYLDDFVDIKVVESDGTIINEKTMAIPLETISGCTEVISTTAGQQEIVKKINTRYVFELEEAPYLVRFIVSDATKQSSFRAAILSHP